MQTFNIGRNTANEIVLDDKMVSRQHAQLIVLNNGQVILKDLGSSNGTFVNGNKIAELNLKAGDIVKCGNTFVKWTQYIRESTSQSSPISDQNYDPTSVDLNSLYSEVADDSDRHYSLSQTIKYLTTNIFNVGDLFRTGWDKAPSILFFLLTPIAITLFISLYFYSQTQNSFFIENNIWYMVFLPLILSVFIYGVSQFLTLTLLSIAGETTALVKKVFASSIVSFLQFSIVLTIAGLAAILSFLENGTLIEGIMSWHNYYMVLILGTVTIITSLAVTLITFIYKYFRTIGVPSGISIHLIILTLALNLLFQISFTYFFISFTIKDFNF
jgi:pSer/pThr/pTyr-binding forkhead associated (FHA) protein